MRTGKVGRRAPLYTPLGDARNGHVFGREFTPPYNELGDAVCSWAVVMDTDFGMRRYTRLGDLCAPFGKLADVYNKLGDSQRFHHLKERPRWKKRTTRSR